MSFRNLKLTFMRLAVLAVCVSTFSSLSAAQKLRVAAVITEPLAAGTIDYYIFKDQNVTCAQLNAIPNNGPTYGSAFNHIVDDYSLKLDFGTPNGTYQFRTYSAPGSVVLTGTQPTPTRTLTVSSSGDDVLSWSSQVAITAVVVKVGNDSYVWPYSPFAFSDTGLIHDDHRSISHLTFCYSPVAVPTAANATVSGRVVTASGNSIRGALVTAVNASNGQTKTVITNSFGYYTISGLEVENLYSVSVNSKGRTFSSGPQWIMLNEDVTGVIHTSDQ